MMEGFVEESVVRTLIGSGPAASSLLLLAGGTWDFAAAEVGENPDVDLEAPFGRRMGMQRFQTGWRYRLGRSQ
jgi:hypothetical protein